MSQNSKFSWIEAMPLFMRRKCGKHPSETGQMCKTIRRVPAWRSLDGGILGDRLPDFSGVFLFFTLWLSKYQLLTPISHLLYNLFLYYHTIIRQKLQRSYSIFRGRIILISHQEDAVIFLLRLLDVHIKFIFSLRNRGIPYLPIRARHRYKCSF